MVTAGTDDQDGNERDPRNPDGPFDPVELAAGCEFVVDGLAEFLQSTGWAGPSTPQSSQEQRSEEHQSKYDKTAVDDDL